MQSMSPPRLEVTEAREARLTPGSVALGPGSYLSQRPPWGSLSARVLFLQAAPSAPSPHVPAQGLLPGRRTPTGVRRTSAVLPQALWAHFSTEK